MSITLARFSQEVDVASGSMAVTYFAVFRSAEGRELKLPISQQASQELISFMADKGETKEAEQESIPEDDLQDATEFGNEPLEDDDYQDEDVPDSEEEVPSL